MNKILAVLALLALAWGQATAQEQSWACDGSIDGDRDEIREIATNISMYRILQEYRDRWDAAHIRAQCEAYAAGEPYEIGCLNDRRDWSDIKALVPDELFGRSTRELRPYFIELSESDDGHGAAIDYCRSVGAIR